MSTSTKSAEHNFSLRSGEAIEHYQQRLFQGLEPSTAPQESFVPFERSEINQTICERFEKQVAIYSDRLAVKAKGQSLTYDQLNRAANRVAQAILTRHRKGEELIALLLEQGMTAVVAILGVLKAGKFYVSLDPSYPRDWLGAIVEDAQASLIVSDNINLPSAMSLARESRHVLNIDDLDSNLTDENPGLSFTPDTFAYLFYTSGSTGQPKGIVQNHRHVLHQIMSYTNSLQLVAGDRFTLLHSHGFSASRLDIFGSLLNGAALFPFSVAEEGTTKLARWMVEEQITVFHWVPTAFRHVVDGLTDQESLPTVRRIVLGSEPVSARDVESYKKHFASGCLLVNRFGMTETGNVCLYFIDKAAQFSGGIVPVGFAIEDTQVLLLDQTGNQVGYNQIGEIAIEGPYLSPGYWRQPELTRGCFLPDPAAPDKRIFQTGDMGYMLPDGCLVHLGRKDFQVKIRGHRIELEQVERALLEHPAIRGAAVAVHDQTSEEKRLVAYIVVSEESTVPSNELRGFLEARLPIYMVPAAFVHVDALPLTPSGKVDRQSLPDPDNAALAIDTLLAEACSPAERMLVEIWSDVLGIDRVGIHDSFFDLGGHSLLANRIISRVVDTFGVEISLREFFDHPTVAHTAKIVNRNVTSGIGADEINILADVESLSEEESHELLKKDGR